MSCSPMAKRLLDLNCQQLDRLKAALMQKRPSLINRGLKCLSTGQFRATHIFGEAPEAPGARMVGSFASTT